MCTTFGFNFQSRLRTCSYRSLLSALVTNSFSNGMLNVAFVADPSDSGIGMSLVGTSLYKVLFRAVRWAIDDTPLDALLKNNWHGVALAVDCVFHSSSCYISPAQCNSSRYPIDALEVVRFYRTRLRRPILLGYRGRGFRIKVMAFFLIKTAGFARRVEGGW